MPQSAGAHTAQTPNPGCSAVQLAVRGRAPPTRAQLVPCESQKPVYVVYDRVCTGFYLSFPPTIRNNFLALRASWHRRRKGMRMTGRACGAHAGRLMAQKRRGRAGVAVVPGMLRRASTRAVQMGFFTRLDGIPEPPSGYIPPEGASRNTWANIYKNKGRIDYCVQQFGVSCAPACLRAAWSAWVSCGRLRSTSPVAPAATRPEQGTGRLSVGLTKLGNGRVWWDFSCCAQA